MIVDLCSGLGRWETSEEVIRVDIDRRTKPTIIADIRYLPLKKGLKPRLCHASPPCTYISKARRWAIGWAPLGIAETFKIWAACYEAFAWLEAEHCTIENPRGIEDFLGVKVQFKYDKGADLSHKNCTTNFYSNSKGLKRAIIPQDVRQKILNALT